MRKLLFFWFLLELSACGQKDRDNMEVLEKPNIIVILVDDMGYSDIGSFGGEIPTPGLDSLAANGFTMTQFYNAGRCCPTRASLLTGLYPHQSGVGHMDHPRKNAAGDIVPAYQGYLNNKSVTLGEVMKQNGYQTFLSGKWHVGSEEYKWPIKRGFDNAYTFVYGAGSYFNTQPYRPSNRPSVITYNDSIITDFDEDFYLTNAITEHAVAGIDSASRSNDPFFMYIAYTAPHWPLHALPEDIIRFEGMYMGGWDSLRNVRYKKMQGLGIIDSSWALPPKFMFPNDSSRQDYRGEMVELTPVWDELSVQEKRMWDRRMAVYAAMVYRMDQGVKRIIEKLKEKGEYENTLVMFMSDNGACHEPVHVWDITYDQSGEIGTKASFDGYSYPWANVSNTPFRMFKHWTMEGGISTPFIAHWPARIKPNTDRLNYGHVMDIMATAVDAAQGEYPAVFNQKSITPLEGESLLPLFEGTSSDTVRYLFWEHEGNVAVRKGKWKLVKSSQGVVDNLNEFFLYNLQSDRVELMNVADEYPEITSELKQAYNQWASRVGVVDYSTLN